MAAAVSIQPMVALLRQLAVLLDSTHESRWARSLSDLADAAEGASSEPERQAVVRQVLGVFGGMGSFSDLVLQTRDGVRPEQGQLHDLRSRLFEASRGALS